MNRRAFEAQIPTGIHAFGSREPRSQGKEVGTLNLFSGRESRGHSAETVDSTLVSPKVIQSLKLSFSLKPRDFIGIKGISHKIAVGHSFAKWK